MSRCTGTAGFRRRKASVSISNCMTSSADLSKAWMRNALAASAWARKLAGTVTWLSPPGNTNAAGVPVRRCPSTTAVMVNMISP
ncbi:hypothetical protein D3C78_1553060 [compost metagenome]